MIGSSNLAPGDFNQHLVSRSRKKKKVTKVLVAGLMLTAMVDMFSVLVIFLLQSFSSSPEIMALTEGVKLPAAMTASSPVDAPVISISKEKVLLDQKEMGTTKKLFRRPGKMIKKLQSLKQTWAQSHPDAKFKGDIHLQADKGIPSTLVSEYINILISQGYSSIHLAVTAGGGS